MVGRPAAPMVHSLPQVASACHTHSPSGALPVGVLFDEMSSALVPSRQILLLLSLWCVSAFVTGDLAKRLCRRHGHRFTLQLRRYPCAQREVL
jgi:hypothetical protein